MKKVYIVIKKDGAIVAVFRAEWEAYFYVERSGVSVYENIVNKLDLCVKEMPVDPDWKLII